MIMCRKAPEMTSNFTGHGLTGEARWRGGVALSPLGDVAALDGGGHQVGEGVRRAGERGHPERGQRGGVVVVVAGRALVGQREQDDHLRRRRRSSSATRRSISSRSPPSYRSLIRTKIVSAGRVMSPWQ